MRGRGPVSQREVRRTGSVRAPAERSRACPRSRGGWTLLEVTIGITLLTVGLLASSRAILQSTRVSETVREVSIATSEARRMIETLHATDFSQVFATFNDNQADDPGGAGSAPGSGWAVAQLDARDDDADGLVGQIIFPTAAGGGVLREDIADLALGMPRDLDGDGIVDGADHSTDYRILPVLVRMRWAGHSGPGVLEFRTVLADL